MVVAGHGGQAMQAREDQINIYTVGETILEQ